MTYTSKPITVMAYILAVPLVLVGFFVALGCGITYFVQDKIRAWRGNEKKDVNNPTAQGRKPSPATIATTALLVAVLCVCNGCFIIAGTGNVKVDGGIEQAGTAEAWTAFGQAAGVAGGTAGKIMTRP